jgi:hypothetical protein
MRPKVSSSVPEMSKNESVMDVTRRLGSPRFPEHLRP